MDIDRYKLYIKLRYNIIYNQIFDQLNEHNLLNHIIYQLPPIDFTNYNKKKISKMIDKILFLQSFIDKYDNILLDTELIEYDIYENNNIIDYTKIRFLINRDILVELDINKLYLILQLQINKINMLTQISDELRQKLLNNEKKEIKYNKYVKKLIENINLLKDKNEKLKNENIKLIKNINLTNKNMNTFTYEAKVTIDHDSIKKLLNKSNRN